MTNIIMDVVLMGLLIAALWFGVRLDKKLKALRAAHEGFARAVGELDDAAIRAHSSLKELRGHADDSQELLHGRILAARDLLQKLDVQVSRADKAGRELDRGIEAAEAARLMQMQAPVSRRKDFDDPALMLRNVVTPAPQRDPGVSARRGPFDRDVVREDDPLPTPRNAGASGRAVRPEASTHLKGYVSRLPEQMPEDETEILDKVQMSELVVANLNEMIRTLTLPKRQPLSLEDDLFGPDSSLK
ncbi:DUF6468 domain-containing protein [Asticcacaulis sp. AC402]|uniref:DUF6468 domain-containing protein n=1 Tax=Asticcacaulis sp. AC402 TaxID=1282361 RepID=UPI0003C3D1A7|nr:DUF6468 domain-containing protein [Asticcacaulis sp. AC402]ESQ73549.1 hypothetical protein ABAC402_18720 [Asticcacaulis sp. AC402]